MTIIATKQSKSTLSLVTSLEDRIADAIEAKLSSEELSNLLTDVDLADVAAKEASRLASDKALDPSTRPDKVEAARREMADADFRSKRLEIAAQKLSELHKLAVDREEAEERARQAKVAYAERDQLVKDLEEYDVLANRIVDLLMRLQANNRKVPSDETAEIIARNAGVYWVVNVDDTLPKLPEATKLPKFRRDGTNYGYIWPPASRY
jgi:hypothetical protein